MKIDGEYNQNEHDCEEQWFKTVEKTLGPLFDNHRQETVKAYAEQKPTGDLERGELQEHRDPATVEEAFVGQLNVKERVGERFLIPRPVAKKVIYSAYGK